MTKNLKLRVKMVGIDHNRATIEYREHFAFTKAGAMEAMRVLKENYPMDGCVIISTCNRTELWISAGVDLSPRSMLCALKEADPDRYKDLFVERKGEEAVWHLLKLACGLDSRIFGEDQILSQVREALDLARMLQCTDMVLEKVFQTAIGAAKKVKSKVRLAGVDGSAALQVLALLKEKLGDIRGVSCLMIGNGKMGRLVAGLLAAQGAEVKMTLRKAVHGSRLTEQTVPEGCAVVPYEDRIRELASSKVVISATRSPHYTLKKNEVEGRLNKEPSIWIDLAVPRDIEPEIGALPGITLFDIDHIVRDECGGNKEKGREEAMEILREYMHDLDKWFAFREIIPEIQDIVKLSVEDVFGRLRDPIGSVPLPEEEKKRLRTAIEQAVEKSVGKLLFGLKDTLREPLWQECLAAVRESASRETLKS